MILTTERLTLRPSGPEYLHSTWRYSSDPENTRYMMNLPNDTIEECADYLLNAEAEWRKPCPMNCDFAILKDGEHIGGINLFMEEGKPTEAELGWILRKDCWGKGYATEAARALVRYAKEQRGITRLSAHCDGENAASARVMEKLGMQLVHRERGRRNKGSAEDREELTYTMDI